ncbi:glycosyl hydrolase [Chitinispirillales bacterium ANBcel5]|uniref:glycoside hydrolase family 26 protein n=1 Tax=Cellulosispirillum alkaliphilum TaxID=3039283 RepID=UPI002A5677F1|nr:glycosyl hydrolase [Chitinispirillales bacterium ANBcel5]
MNKKYTVAGLTVLYCSFLAVLFLGVLEFEKFARNWYFENITRRNVVEINSVDINECVLGIYRPELPYVFSKTEEIEEGIGEQFNIISFYQAWGDGEGHTFPMALMEHVHQSNRVPMLTWEPWVNRFHSDYLRPMPQREIGLVRDIADGVYDAYIEQWAKGAVRWGKPFFLRFAHEMSNPQYPWSPDNKNTEEDFIDAWIHVRSIFASVGATNAIWVWSPYKVGDIKYYPGDDYVDWVALDIFNYGDLIQGNQWARWLTFDQLLTPIYLELEDIDKPFMIAEVGSVAMGGSREVWYREMFEQITNKFKKIRAVIFFDNPADRTSGRKIDWALNEYDIEEIRGVLPSTCFTFLGNYKYSLTK